MLIDSILTADDRRFCWLFLPALNLMTIHIIIARIIAAITTPPITDARSVMLNEMCVVGMLVGIFEILVIVVVTITVTIDVGSLIVILHSFMKS